MVEGIRYQQNITLKLWNSIDTVTTYLHKQVRDIPTNTVLLLENNKGGVFPLSL